MRQFRWLALVSAMVFLAFAGTAQSDEPALHPVMHPDQATLEEWVRSYDEAPAVDLAPPTLGGAAYASSIDLSSYLAWDSSNMSERNQGDCGNCWVWAGTGILETALGSQNGIRDRLSEQFVNSCGSGSSGYSCCGGWLSNLVSFYKSYGYAIPWSNSGASWQDGSRYCALGASTQSCSGISTSTKYALSSISEATITTQGQKQATAINNIKYVLNQGKAVWFAFYMPTYASRLSFNNFWDDNAELDVWTPSSCGQSWDETYGAAHAVLCVGYDSDSWLMLNSWGTNSNRPNGLFRITTNLDYSCTFVYGSKDYYAYYFQTLDVAFSTPNHAPTTPSDPTPADDETDVSVTPTLSWTGGDQDNDTVTYRVVLDTASSPTTSVYTGTATSFSPGTLAAGTDYYWRVYATDEHGSATTGPIWHFRTLENDDFADAIVISRTVYTTTEATTGAATASDDPSVTTGTCGSFSGKGGRSVWYQYTPAASGTFTITTENSSYDTVLAVWTGGRGALQLASCNDDVDSTDQSRTTLSLSAGTTYHIEVMDWASPGAGGTLDFAMSPEMNRRDYLPIIMKND